MFPVTHPFLTDSFFSKPFLWTRVKCESNQVASMLKTLQCVVIMAWGPRPNSLMCILHTSFPAAALLHFSNIIPYVLPLSANTTVIKNHCQFPNTAVIFLPTGLGPNFLVCLKFSHNPSVGKLPLVLTTHTATLDNLTTHHICIMYVFLLCSLWVQCVYQNLLELLVYLISSPKFLKTRIMSHLPFSQSICLNTW